MKTPSPAARPLLVALGVVLVLAVVVLGVVLRRSSDSGHWRALERAASDATISGQAAALDPVVRDAFVAGGRSLLPPGNELRIAEDTMRPMDSDFAVVDAEVVGPSPGHWRLTLLRQPDGDYLIYSTVEE
jgi:hypothetical protein